MMTLMITPLLPARYEVFSTFVEYVLDIDKCDEYAKALQNYIDGGCEITGDSGLGVEAKLATETAQKVLDELDCG